MYSYPVPKFGEYEAVGKDLLATQRERCVYPCECGRDAHQFGSPDTRPDTGWQGVWNRNKVTCSDLGHQAV